MTVDTGNEKSYRNNMQNFPTAKVCLKKSDLMQFQEKF